MTTARKHETNRRNALQSTGPRTDAGKLRAAKNRISHGLLSRETLLPGEDRKEFEALADGLRRALDPKDIYEGILVDTIVKATWRLRRLGRMEHDILSWSPSQDPVGGVVILDPNARRRIIELPDNGRGPKPADEVRANAKKPPRPIGLAFLQGCGSSTDAFIKLARYETSIEKSFYRAAHELERRQLARRGGHVPPPVAVDLLVTGEEDGRPGGPTRTPQPTMLVSESRSIEHAGPNGDAAPPPAACPDERSVANAAVPPGMATDRTDGPEVHGTD